MAKLETIYKIRGQIPAHVVERSGLLSKAHEIGLNLAVDDDGNVEGAWHASLLTLATVLKMLEEAGVQNPLIQRRVVTLIIAAEVSKMTELIGVLRASDVSDISQGEDVFSSENILRCTVSCEGAEQLEKGIVELGVRKVIATESYEVVATDSSF